ncbi:MAG: ATP-binding protein [Deltaproteobacteria bacterium]|nr:ATP-binding protein [Deltaproteobacteria bacterium]
MAALRFVPGPWLLVDRETTAVLAANRPLEQILGVDRSCLFGHPVATITCEGEVSGWALKALDADMIRLPGLHEDVGLRRADGSPMPVDVHVSHPPVFKRSRVAFCLVSDRTEQRRLEGELIAKHKEIRRAFAELERKSAELALAQETLKRKNRELGALSVELSRAGELATIGEVTAELVHQFSNPLAAAVGTVRQIARLTAPDERPEIATAVAVLRKSLDRLTDTMAEARRLYRSSRPQDKPKTAFDLAGQVEGALALMQQRLELSRLIVQLPPDLPKIAGRPSQIQHVIVNLLENAVEAAGPGGTVQMRASRIDGKVVFAVGDSGPGVPEPLKSRIFEPFYTTRPQGTGLGLALVRRNLDADGATIEVGKSAHGGAEFRIAFPVAHREGEQ